MLAHAQQVSNILLNILGFIFCALFISLPSFKGRSDYQTWPFISMAKSTKTLMLPDELVMNKIYMIRGYKIMLDRDLAELYGVTTGNLNLAVKRNKKRFPGDFLFQLTKEEFEALILQNAISKSSGRGGIRKLPYAFTEQGVSMLSGVLNSDIAIQVHIQIIRVFAKMREMLFTHKDILLQLEKMKKTHRS